MIEPKICHLCEEGVAIQWVIHDGQRIKICKSCFEIILDEDEKVLDGED